MNFFIPSQELETQYMTASQPPQDALHRTPSADGGTLAPSSAANQSYAFSCCLGGPKVRNAEHGRPTELGIPSNENSLSAIQPDLLIPPIQNDNAQDNSEIFNYDHGHNYEFTHSGTFYNTAYTSWLLPDGPFLPWMEPTAFTSMIPNLPIDVLPAPWVDPSYNVFQPALPTIGNSITDTQPTLFPGTPLLAPANLAPNPSQRRGAGATFRQDVAEPRVRCEFPGCNKSFRRTGDCRRHMRKHNPVRAYSCVVDACGMKFYRLDKLRDHARDGHNITL